MRDAGLPVTLIVVGLVWLAWQFRLFPDIDWIIAAGLVAGGIAVMAFDGITKSSVVIGPFLIATGAAWALHEFQRVDWKYLIPGAPHRAGFADAGRAQSRHSRPEGTEGRQAIAACRLRPR